jgi:DNA (cytosine-5)-methyltransferase 3A
MRVLSLFDGISCARVALERANIPVTDYFASEIDKYAIQISHKNWPTIKRLGNVKDVSGLEVDLLIGGSPCQDLSVAKKGRKGLAGDRSSLFWEYVRILNECKPKWFILENVNSMSKDDKDTITKALGVEPIMINASLVSAQNRKRLFWTNIPSVSQPADRNIMLKDILEKDIDETVKCGRNIGRRLTKDGTRNDNDKSLDIIRRIEVHTDDKCGTLTSVMKDNLVVSKTSIRKLTPIECERLQGLPDKYTEGVSDTQRYKCLGNAFNVDVIAHILSFIPT